MKRLFRLTFLMTLLAVLGFLEVHAQQVYVSGRIAPGDVRVFLKDSIYIIDHDLMIGGTLIIEPGTEVRFHPNGRIIDSTGGRIIADGDAYANYNPNPDGIVPLPGSSNNPFNWTGYADLDYFLYPRTIEVGTQRDRTVHEDKEDYIFNVILNKNTRRITDLVDPGNPYYPTDPNEVIIPFEKAIIFQAARMYADPSLDVNLNINPWKELGGTDVEFENETIRFVGEATTNFSQEWGHFVILPGARAAFFRNATFEGFKKDTTVDRRGYYNLTSGNWPQINENLIDLTNGSGGVITTFSSRTWLLDVEFLNNTARYKGGALQILQAPEGYPIMANVNDIGYYPENKNPSITDKDGTISDIVQNNPIPQIDKIDEPGMAEPLSNAARQAYDDGRLAVYLGRMRNLTFTGNKIQLANVVLKTIGGVKVVMDDFDNPADYPQQYGDAAYGGAIYIAGRPGDDNRQIEIGFGINDRIRISGDGESGPQIINFAGRDRFEVNGNRAENYQNGYSTFGARGGAIYLGRYTSLIVAGHFESNETYAKFLQDSLTGAGAASYSMGGAIYSENSFNRLQVRGGQARDMFRNQTRFIANKAGAGGAIYVDGNVFPMESPVIGGSDQILDTRDYGFNIIFENNSAVAHGGAIFTKRNMSSTGAGGTINDDETFYGGKYPIRFWNNTAGYSGGAISIDIPNAYPELPAHQRVIHLVRNEFLDNVVGENIAELNKVDIMGGGAIHSLSGDLNLVKGTQFTGNKVYNGNGGAIEMVHPLTSSKRFFISDLDHVTYDADGIAIDYTSEDRVFTWSDEVPYEPDTRMLTMFLNNSIELDSTIIESQMGSGITQVTEQAAPFTEDLYSTVWLNDQTGYAVGYNGTIIKFEDRGENWEFQKSGTGYRLTDVFFTSTSKGFVVGDRGIILMTTNGGANWNPVTSPTDERINDIFFVGTQSGYAVTNAGYILKTVDGGMTWSSSHPQTSDLLSVFFPSATEGYVVGDRGMILKTTDAGQNWVPYYIPGIISALNDIFFISTTNGYIVGNDGVILVTKDAGQTWDVVLSGTNADLYDVQMTDVSKAYISGRYGYILRTMDGGSTWSMLPTNVSNDMYSVYFPSMNHGYSVGDYGTVIQTTDGGDSWTAVNDAEAGFMSVTRYHQKARLPENGVGLGGAIYLLDSATTSRIGRSDSVSFNRVRIEANTAFTGSAIYSDNFDLKLIMNRSMVASNIAYSNIGLEQNVIVGPAITNPAGEIIENHASSDLASATIYGELQGPLPNYLWPEAGNSIYNNEARFIVRLPDAPNTKGPLAGGQGIGVGGTDTLRGNYWGYTDADVSVFYEHMKGTAQPIQETFFIGQDPYRNDRADTTYLRFVFDEQQTNPFHQGPFESRHIYNYTPLSTENVDDDETMPADGTLPINLVMAGHIYDIYDKGTDIKTADYSQRRLTPIEDFAVGIPPRLRRFADTIQPSFEKYVKRWVRDPFLVEAVDAQGDTLYPFLRTLQTEFRPNAEGNFVHPIGYPLFLEAQVNYESEHQVSNHDVYTPNESVFFVINETTGDFIRVNLRQVTELAPYREIFRKRVELIPDSSLRNPNTLYRRTTEGLLNLGTGDFLLRQLEDNPYNEAGAALRGRRYHAAYDRLGGVPVLFSNRPEMPPSNEGFASFWAGEKFSALPVIVGDQIRVISRTVLWREGVVPAYDEGISFEVVDAFEPPVFTGNIYDLRNQIDTVLKPSKIPWKQDAGLMDTVVYDFRDMIFVTEDRYYPVNPGVYSLPADRYDRGRDSILTITAMDTNRFFDPRSLLDGENFTNLTYTWSVEPNSGLSHWLQADTIWAEHWDPNVQNPRDNALGYFLLRGQPINPYVVPGGETVSVSSSNYPPGFRTIDSLRRLGVGQDTIDAFIEVFRPYLSQPTYDMLRARFLQQDTINHGFRFQEEYAFEIFVVDSIPRFLAPGTQSEVVYKYDSRGNETDTLVVYEPSIYKCGQSTDGSLIATLTDKLRFQVDLNTNDELEDKAAAPTWNFRYGRTSYGYQNVIISGIPDTVVIDTVIVYDEEGELDTLLSQVRPIWMAKDYMMQYDSDDSPDQYNLEFMIDGRINIRIDSAQAATMLTPDNQNWGELNTDSVFTVIVNDGHGGLNKISLPVRVNVQPRIMTQSLAVAKEGIDFNPQLLDSASITDSRGVLVSDPNFGQTHTFELIKADYPNDTIYKDPCFPEAGFWVVTDLKVTPEWLYINRESGILYGTPLVTDAPKTEQVVVLVTDEDGLSDLKIYDLEVEKTNHGPRFALLPKVECVEIGKRYVDTIYVVDLDLTRIDETETVTLNVLSPQGVFTISPSSISGPTDDTVRFEISADPFQINQADRDKDGRITVEIEVTDADGESSVKKFRLQVSDPTLFSSIIKVANSKGAFELLSWGTASTNYEVSTGDGTDGNEIGQLDENFCEYELPPMPNADVFDARWDIPLINGTDRNIYPGTLGNDSFIYKAVFQAGGVQGGQSGNYPVTLEWDSDEIPAVDNQTANPQGSSWHLRDCFSDGDRFSVNMKTGDARIEPGVANLEQNGSIYTLTILQSSFECFVIWMDTFTDVAETTTITNTEIKSVSPNPFSSQTTVEFNVYQPAKVKLEVVDVLGNVVMTIANDNYGQGTHTITWDGVDASGKLMPAGKYTVRLTAGTVTSTSPVVIVR